MSLVVSYSHETGVISVMEAPEKLLFLLVLGL
jgi:hypothetical protein